MDNKELLDLIDKSIVGESGIDRELKEKFYNYDSRHVHAKFWNKPYISLT